MTRFQFDAYAALENLRERYAAYLIDTFGIRSPELGKRLREHWSDRGDSAYPLLGPSLVQAAFPFATSRSLSELGKPRVAERAENEPLHPRTVEMLRGPLGFKLFSHQEEAIRAASRGRTTILSAGTGSGKTEAFLVSMIDALHWAEERGEDNLDEPGVRAIVIYPLNALVNNQIARMQQLLRAQDRIRFAFYTSRLPETYRAAERWYTQRGFDLPPKCQLIDRRTVRGGEVTDGRPVGPPHILVTNFSMLEYMLIRPLDRAFFLPHHLLFKGKPRLRVIVLDEAHVYAGAQATEIHMLLRRAALRFGTSLDAVQGIATSATLAQGADEASQRKALAEYGARMFAKPAEEVAVVLASPVLPPSGIEATRNARLTAPASETDLVPAHLRTLEFDEDGRPIAFVKDAETARAVATACVKLGVATESNFESLSHDERDVPALVAWKLLCLHTAIHQIRRRLHASTGAELPTLAELATEVFGAATLDETRAMDALLRLGSVARRRPDEHPLIPTRMHAWLRAPAGVWVEAPTKPPASGGAWPWQELRSSPPTSAAEAQSSVELVVCDTCGREYVLAFSSMDDWGRVAYVGIDDGDSEPRAFADAPDGPDALPWAGMRGFSVHLDRGERGRLKGACAFCKDSRATFRRLVLSPRAALGALVDGLYPYLAVHPTATTSKEYRPGHGRRLLTFSDSRQEAARVAHDVELSHNVGLNRAVIYRALQKHGGQSVKITDLIDDLAHDKATLERAEAAEAADERRRNVEFREKLAELGVYQELARPPVDAATLESLGFVEIVYPNLPAAPSGIGLAQAEWESFVATVLDIARAQGAVARASSDMPEDLRSRVPRFIDRPIVRTAPEQEDEEEEAARPRRRFVPLLSTKPNARLRAYAEQVAKRAGTQGGGERLLDAVWQALKVLSEQTRWLRWSEAPEGYLINLPKLSLRTHDKPPLIEPISGRLFPRGVRGVAPVGAKPAEDLRPLSEEEVAQWRARNGVRRVLGDEILGLATKEHTAQIDVDALDEAERAFRGGKTNLLACSTTMEMGVDLGGLTLVMMTNVPPAAANYWQRAGRAGRRADGSSLALSLALQLPHDQKVFRRPQHFLAEPMVPPQVRFDLPALLLRHVFAHLLAAFFEDAVVETAYGNPLRAFGTTGDFFATPVASDTVRAAVLENAPDARSMADVFAAWLDGLAVDGSVAARLEQLRRGTVLAGRTTSELATACRTEVMRIAEAVRRDLAIIEDQQQAQLALGENSQDRTLLNALRHQARTVKDELLIAQLAKGDVLPRFGFPLDVVRLDTKWRISDREEETKSDREEDPALRMERDLKLALSDYVPGTKVLAAKELHRSAGLVRNWYADDEDKARVGFFVHCGSCGYLEERRTTELKPCALCGHPVADKLADAPDARESEIGPTPIRQYLIPSSFAVKATERPERPDGFANPEKMPPAFVYVSAAGRLANFVELGSGLSVGFEPSTKVAFRSEGRLAKSGRRGYGYAVCQRCGRAEPEEAWDKAAPPENVRTPHEALRGRGRCSGKLWRRIALGTFGVVDTLRIRLTGPLAPRAGIRRADEEDFFMSLAVCLQELVSERLKVDRRTLSAAVGTWKAPDGSVTREAIVWDPSTSGVLEHVLPDAADIVCELVEKLDREPDLLSYVRFDNQFMVAQGRFRLDLLRSHFLDEVRRQHLPTRGATVDLPAEPRPEPLRSRAMEALEDATPPMSFVAPSIASDAFAPDGLLRIVHATQLRHSRGVRLLLNKPPRADQRDEAALAGRLRALIESGAEVRVLADEAVFAAYPRVFYTVRGARRALGAVRRENDVWNPTTECFGASWGRGFVTVEASGELAEQTFAAFEKAWDRAAALDPVTLLAKASTGLHYVAIREGATGGGATSLPAIVAKHVGPPADLGNVARALYVDRYVTRSALATWNMFRTLEAFKYAPGAKVRFRCLVPRGAGDRQLVHVFRDRAWDPLSPKEVARFCDAFTTATRADARMDDVIDRDEGGTQMRHGRKLLVEFEPGSKLRTLKIDLEAGMDWIRATPPRNWNRSTLTARETHFVIIENHDLDAEKDAQGRSDWTDIFGASGDTARG